jgi:WD40 repeat protein
MSSASAVRERRIGVPFSAESIKSQSQLNRESTGDSAMLATIVPKKLFERYEKAGVRRMSASGWGVGGGSTIGGGGGNKSPRPRVDTSASAASPSPSSPPPVVTPPPSSSASSSTSTSGKLVTVPVRDDHIHSGLFAFHEDSKLLFSCGHWDHSFKVTAVESGRTVQSVSHHRDVITCLSLGTEYHSTWLVSGSRDCTVMVWEVLPERESSPVTVAPLFTLFGHDGAVTSIRVCPKLNVVVSGSEDGTMIVHSLREGAYIRSIVVGPRGGLPPPGGSPFASPMGGGAHEASASPSNADAGTGTGTGERRRISWIGITPDGEIVAYLLDDHLLCSYTVNGRHLASRTIKDKLHALTLSTDGKVLVTGGNNGLVVLRWVSNIPSLVYTHKSLWANIIFFCINSFNIHQIHTLQLANTGARKDLEAVFDGSSQETSNEFPPFNSPIRSLCLTRSERHLIVGLESGDIRILAHNSEYIKDRSLLQKKLTEIGT